MIDKKINSFEILNHNVKAYKELKSFQERLNNCTETKYLNISFSEDSMCSDAQLDLMKVPRFDQELSKLVRKLKNEYAKEIEEHKF